MQWTISNQLTVGRVVLIPVLVLVFYVLPSPWRHYASALLFALAGVTDWLDGYLARTRGEVTAFGRFLDPVADKLLVATALVMLVDMHEAPAVLAIIIIGREITIGALREWLAERASLVHVSQLGKWKTAVQICAIEALFFHEPVLGVHVHDVGIGLLWLASMLTLWSGYDYLRSAWPDLKRVHRVHE